MPRTNLKTSGLSIVYLYKPAPFYALVPLYHLRKSFFSSISGLNPNSKKRLMNQIICELFDGNKNSNYTGHIELYCASTLCSMLLIGPSQVSRNIRYYSLKSLRSYIYLHLGQISKHSSIYKASSTAYLLHFSSSISDKHRKYRFDVKHSTSLKWSHLQLPRQPPVQILSQNIF